MISEMLSQLLGWFDGTNDNDEDANEKLKVIEREKIKLLKRR